MKLTFVLLLLILCSCEPINSTKNDLPPIILIDDSDIFLMLMLNTNSKDYSAHVLLELKMFIRETKIDPNKFVKIEFYKFSNLDYKKMYYNEEYESLKQEKLFSIKLKKTKGDSIIVDRVYFSYDDDVIII